MQLFGLQASMQRHGFQALPWSRGLLSHPDAHVTSEPHDGGKTKAWVCITVAPLFQNEVSLH